MAGIKGTLLRAFYAETGSLTDRKKPAKSYDFADFLSYLNTIDFFEIYFQKIVV